MEIASFNLANQNAFLCEWLVGELKFQLIKMLPSSTFDVPSGEVFITRFAANPLPDSVAIYPLVRINKVNLFTNP